MSFLATIKTEIKDINMFKKICDQNAIQYVELKENKVISGYKVKACLTDSTGEKMGYLVQEGLNFRMLMAQDIRYNKNAPIGFKLTREYAEQSVMNGLYNTGGVLTERIEQPDGSLILKVGTYN